MSNETRWHYSSPEMDERSHASKRYAFAIAHLLKLGARTSLKLIREFPTVHEITDRDGRADARLESLLGNRADSIRITNWQRVLAEAQDQIEIHARHGIEAITIQQPQYPTLLKLISDPPVILFIKGNLLAATSKPGIAVIGTRNTTPIGEMVARKVSRFFGENGFSIVSGLAKGIDAAAHEGALESRSPTVAVFATPLDKVYPAENRDLANRILDQGGAWLGELPLFAHVHRNSFVERDRIQSGLSVAVVPVQTDIKGGTMHTVGFAEKQRRLLLCPRPLQTERFRDQYRGINMLVESRRAESFDSAQYDHVLEIVKAHLATFLGSPDNIIDTAPARSFEVQLPLGISPASSSADDPPSPSTESRWTPKEIIKVSKSITSVLRSSDPAEFDELIRLVKLHLADAKGAKPKRKRRTGP